MLANAQMLLNCCRGSMVTVDMIARMPGNWLYHCHVADHITAGMNTRWRVVPKR